MSRGRGNSSDTILYGHAGARGNVALDNTSGKKVFERKIIETLTCRPLSETDDFFLVTDQKPAGFITTEDKKKLEKSTSPLDLFEATIAVGAYGMSERKIPVYNILRPEARNLLEDYSLEEFIRDFGSRDDLFLEPEDALAKGYFIPENLISFNDNNFYRPHRSYPVTRPQGLELWSEYFDICQAEKLLENHPFVLRTKNKKSFDYYHDGEYGQKEELEIVIKLPDEKWDDVCQWADKYNKGHFDLRQIVCYPAFGGSRSDHNQQLEEFGLTDLLGLREAAKQE